MRLQKNESAFSLPSTLHAEKAGMKKDRRSQSLCKESSRTKKRESKLFFLGPFSVAVLHHEKKKLSNFVFSPSISLFFSFSLREFPWEQFSRICFLSTYTVSQNPRLDWPSKHACTTRKTTRVVGILFLVLKFHRNFPLLKRAFLFTLLPVFDV